MDIEQRKFDDLSKEELAIIRKVFNIWIDKLHASSINMYPLKQEDYDFLAVDIDGNEYFNSYKKQK